MRALLLSSITAVVLVAGCKKKDTEELAKVSSEQVIHHFADNVAFAMYTDMYIKANALENSVNALQNNITIQNLQQSQADWKALRAEWEYSEAFLFGPIADLDLDPAWDDWPVNHQDFDFVLNSSNVLTESYVNGLATSSKGFHALEYILFGKNNNQTISNLTPRKLEYATALAKNIKNIASTCKSAWSTDFLQKIKKAGNGSPLYTNKKAAFLEIVNAVVGICGETGEEKIESVFIAQDPKLEESQFSQNSMNDFKSNIKGAEMVYLGSYKVDGIGLSEWTQQYNKSLDLRIKQAFNEAHNALNAITDPFGVAIISQPNNIQNAVNKISNLEVLLETELLPLVNLKVID